MFFNKDGMFRLDETVAQRATFKKIIDDQTVTDEEIASQIELVLSLYHRMEKALTPEQLELVAEAIAETGVLHSISQYQQLQKLHR